MKVANDAKGFVLPLALIAILIIIVLSIWGYREILVDTWTTVSQKNAAREFYAVESAMYKAIVEKVMPAVNDTFPVNATVTYNYIMPVPGASVAVNVGIRNRGVTTNCAKSLCCQMYEITSSIDGGGTSLRLLVLKSVIDESLCDNIY